MTGEAGARATGKNGGAGGTTGGQSSFNIDSVARKDDAYGELAVVRRVSGVECACAQVEMDFATKRFLQQTFKLPVSGKALMAERGGIGKNGKC